MARLCLHDSSVGRAIDALSIAAGVQNLKPAFTISSATYRGGTGRGRGMKTGYRPYNSDFTDQDLEHRIN